MKTHYTYKEAIQEQAKVIVNCNKDELQHQIEQMEYLTQYKDRDTTEFELKGTNVWFSRD